MTSGHHALERVAHKDSGRQGCGCTAGWVGAGVAGPATGREEKVLPHAAVSSPVLGRLPGGGSPVVPQAPGRETEGLLRHICDVWPVA